MPEVEPREERDLELRSEPVQEIIGRDPNWIIRWGITVVFMTVIMLLVGAWIIKYPEIVSSRVIITTQTPPIRVVSRSNGKIETFLTQEGDRVVSGQYLAVLENTADYSDMEALQNQIKRFQGFLVKPDDYLDVEWNADVVLGDLQIAYSDFLKQFLEYRVLVRDTFNERKINNMNVQIASLERLGEQLAKQKGILDQELELEQKKYDNNRKLFEQNLISESDLAGVESQFLQKKYSVENAGTAIVNNRIRISELRVGIGELEKANRDQRRQGRVGAQEAFKKLVTELGGWEQRYALKSPVDGRVSFFRFWSNNQYVNVGDEVMMIIPGPDDLVGKIYLAQTGAGKVKPGQKVHIKFDSYPYKEYGMVFGEVERVSAVARENQYLVDVALPDGLATVYKKELEFKHNMAGSADIITQDMRLIERIFNQFRYLFTSTV